MQFSKKIVQSMPILLFLVFFTAANATCTYLLNQRDQDLIKIAYMNGAAEMLALDLKDIKMLKRDQRFIKRVVETAANRYLKTVDHLNRPQDRAIAGIDGPRYRTVYLP